MYLRMSLPAGLVAAMLASATAYADDTIKIGVIQPLTG